ERNLTVEPLDWDITVGLSYNASKDDQTGTLDTRVRGAGENFRKHIAKLFFDALDKGDAVTTYGACYDGLSFFNDAHIDPGADYQTGQDNNLALPLTLSNFKTVRSAARTFLDDRGEPVDFMHNLIVCHPDEEYEAAQIADNSTDYETTDRANNPWAGKTTYIESPYITSGEWHYVAAQYTQKPVYIAMREQPALQSAWFDPNAGDGGQFYFKFYGRYDMFYGDWRLAIKGT
ncbi:unnamed protein product, partial [marine sediment metagenome]